MHAEKAHKQILRYLTERGISQAFVSKRSGIEPDKLSQVLRGNRRLTLEEYAIICRVPGVNTDFFLKPILL